MKPFWVRKTILNWISMMLVSAFLILIASSATGEISSTIDVMNDTKNKHTVVPSIPQGELIAEDVKFAKGEKYEVYSGPGKDYLRAADGKAVVSTNDWIQVFGKEDGWILIQYEIDKDHMRFGWIPEKALPKSASVDELSFIHETVTLLDTAFLTDDPLFSHTMLLTLPKGTTVYHLSDMGDWAYIESCSGDCVRGFVNRALIRTGRVYELENCPANNGTQVMNGTLVVKSSAIEADFSSIIHDGYQSVSVQGYCLYDTFTGNLLFKLTNINPNGNYTGSGMLPSDVTSIQIVPILPNGEKAGKDLTVTVEW